ncbi:flavodoxin family protein [Methanobacterium aggregans]|uniref:flavodoxin family protein n=1 Tax=Methanobacterium aggregans TaxID=1615586 RepID=UPI001AE1C4A6|nr:flavodoxin family protein [Methanobacterium aggregans]MBP2045102.1 flavodoxin [Methanobacterium aggregans]
MKMIIIYKSYHHMNTEKVARAMAETMNGDLVRVEDVKPNELEDYDLIGFGSGIYGGKPHRDILKLAEEMQPMDKKVFIFSTSGIHGENYHHILMEKLKFKGAEILGEFNCPGEVRPLGLNLDLKGPLGWFMGKNKGHPNEMDLNNARIFAEDILKSR